MTARNAPAGGRGPGGRRVRPGGGGRGPRRSAAVLAASCAVLVTLAGCGIRSTTVPVDDGAAPSRVACAPPKAPSATSPDMVVHRVYLVCNTQVAPVSRTTEVRDGRINRLGEVRTLLSQLQISPRATETKDGFSTAVPGFLQIDGPVKGDRADALRLNEPLDELPSFALAQIVCTLAADSAVAPDGKVVLGGPAPDGKLRGYGCTSDLLTGTDEADMTGMPLS
ncbi:hypothetical protein SAMN05216223_10718 [Actinacidiphila yanglinensis]|uniref:Sporulation and spore germination n=1 Tax=Actinacidiphila yanglinensis TaxID=310779 RepID=A0A1H6BLT4_9ACTN|nr:hypothetical protein [Actinacidiphila yanglinensis]SEG61633.1 hypothetical protein SAMN05216223_10718 [Actinacidiphila yanglinensis]